jgi:hypothetical protein
VPNSVFRSTLTNDTSSSLDDADDHDSVDGKSDWRRDETAGTIVSARFRVQAVVSPTALPARQHHQPAKSNNVDDDTNIDHDHDLLNLDLDLEEIDRLGC